MATTSDHTDDQTTASIAEKPLRFALLGAGFWARYQLAAWGEVAGAVCVGIYNRTHARAQALAHEFGVPVAEDDADALLTETKPDFVDIVTDVETHRPFVELAARHKIAAICQKPLAPTVADAEAMISACDAAGVPLLVHENWRWQTPLRALKATLDSGLIGRPFRARLDMLSGFSVFTNQPFLATLPQFILTDLGSHILDVARFLFGEAERLTATIHRVHPEIAGEDVATVLLTMRSGVTCIVELAYAGNFLERECFPQTLVFIEGERGSIELAPDYWLRVTTTDGTHAHQILPPRYPWAEPAYDVVHASIVPCHRDLLHSLRTGIPAETNAADNLHTMRLVHAAYASAATGQTVTMDD